MQFWSQDIPAQFFQVSSTCFYKIKKEGKYIELAGANPNNRTAIVQMKPEINRNDQTK